MNIAYDPLPPSSPVGVPRARGQVVLSVVADNTQTRLQKLRQEGSAKVVFPQTAQGKEAVLVNTAGGLTSGDRFHNHIEAGSGAALTVTTQAAERAYAAPGGSAHVETTLIAGPQSRLFWLPQELILFEKADLKRQLHVERHPMGEVLCVEPIVFGRSAMGEVVTDAHLSDCITLWDGAVPQYRDAYTLNGDVTAMLRKPAVGAGARAMATVIFASPRAKAMVDTVRTLIGANGGASLRDEDLLVLRLVAGDGFDLRRALIPVIEYLAGMALPKVWRL